MKIEEIAVWGLGNVSKRYIDKLMIDFKIQYIIDQKKVGISYKHLEVKSYNEVKADLIENRLPIVILTSSRIFSEIAELLSDDGFIENKDFFWIEKFISEVYWQYIGQLCLSEIHVCITSRCTLNCTNCNMFVPYYKKPVDFTFDELKHDADLLFDKVDFVFNYVFLGGEPFLKEEVLCDIINYIDLKYRNKIGRIGIVSNGTCIPSERCLHKLKVAGVEINLSDYTKKVDYGNRLKKVIEELQKWDIPFTVSSELLWCDFGFPVHMDPLPEEKAPEHMRLCSPLFHGLNDGKLFYCHVAWSGEKSGCGYRLEEKDYVDLTKENSNEETRQNIMLHYNGKIKQGYVSFCRLCGGCGMDNTNIVEAGIQKQR